MIAGKQEKDSEKIARLKLVLRKLCPDMGFLENDVSDGGLILSGKNIIALKQDLEALGMIESILNLNEFETRAILSINAHEQIEIVASKRSGEKICTIA